MADIYAIPVTSINGVEQTLAENKGKAMLIVNVASKCGFTPQYNGLEELHKKYGSRGLIVLGFPCNQFGDQEPGSGEQIVRFCQLNYGVTFPLFAKIEVNGDFAHPLYTFLKKEHAEEGKGSDIKWNFTKFLVNREGNVTHRFPSSVEPAEIEGEIKKLL